MKKQEYQGDGGLSIWRIDWNLKKKLAGILALAEGQNGKITVDEVENTLKKTDFSQEQMNLVCDYLLSMKMAVVGQTDRRNGKRG